MYILQIGELSTRLTDSVKTQYNDIPWRDIIGMRNIFAHDYDSIDAGKIWETLQFDIEPLREKCVQIILQSEPDFDPDEEDELLSDSEDDDR